MLFVVGPQNRRKRLNAKAVFNFRLLCHYYGATGCSHQVIENKQLTLHPGDQPCAWSISIFNFCPTVHQNQMT